MLVWFPFMLFWRFRCYIKRPRRWRQSGHPGVDQGRLNAAGSWPGELPARNAAGSWPGELPALNAAAGSWLGELCILSVVPSHPGVGQGRLNAAGSWPGELPAPNAAGSWLCELPAGCVESTLARDVRDFSQFMWRTASTFAPKSRFCCQFAL